MNRDQKPISLQDQSSAPEWTCHTCGGDVLFCACPRAVGDSTPPATEAEALVRGLEDVRAGRIVPLPPVERKPTTLELSGTMPDVSHYSRCARCGGSGREEDASHPPAVSGEGERLKRVIGDSLLALGAVRRRVVSVREENPASAKLASAQQKLEEVINVFEAVLRASTPTPGAPR